MIRIITISILNYIYQWLPYHKRLDSWVNWYQTLTRPFAIMKLEWDSYRDKSKIRAYVSCEKMSLEWYLNELFDSIDREIYIDTPDIGGVSIALQSEVTPHMNLGLQGETPDTLVAVPFYGEDVTIGTADFGVFCPTDIAGMEEEIKQVVNNYRIATKQFVVIYF